MKPCAIMGNRWDLPQIYHKYSLGEASIPGKKEGRRACAQRPPGDEWGEELVLPLRKGDYSIPSRKQYLTASRWLFLNSNLYPFGHFISGRGTDGSPYAISTSFMQKASLGILFGYALQVKAYLSMQFTQAAQRR